MIRLAKQYLSPYLRQTLLLLAALLASAVFNLMLPTVGKRIVNEGIANQDTAYIFRLGLQMMVFLLLALGLMLIVGRLSAQVAMGFSRDLRHALFRHIGTLSQTELDELSTATLISCQVNDVNQVQTVLMNVLNIFLSAPLMAVGGAVMAYITAPNLSWILLAILPLVLIVIAAVLMRVNPLFRENQARLDRLNGIVREILSGMRVVRAFNNEEREKNRIDEAAGALMDTAVTSNRMTVSLLPLLTLLINAANIMTVWFGGHSMMEGLSTYGDVQTFIQYAAQIMTSLAMTSMLMVALPRAITSAERINRIFDKTSSVEEPQQEAVPDVRASIEFDHVSFRYPGGEENVLTDISFRAEAGETIAIIGGTGAGKSTLLHLISRYYDAAVGKVLVNGCDVRRLRQAALRSMLGIVPQKPFLFSGTIYENLCFGKRDATEQEAAHALEIAQASDFVAEKPEGIYSYIAPGGTNVSGGQRQRLSIARAVIRQPKIYLFDDSFSALDFKTDAALRSALAKETRDAVTVIVAQRVGTVMHADQIIVLDRGRAVGIGKHGELLKTCPVYREIALSQLSESEVGA